MCREGNRLQAKIETKKGALASAGADRDELSEDATQAEGWEGGSKEERKVMSSPVRGNVGAKSCDQIGLMCSWDWKKVSVFGAPIWGAGGVS